MMKDNIILHEKANFVYPSRCNKAMKKIRHVFLGLIVIFIVASCEQLPTIVSDTTQAEEPTEEATYTPTATLEPTATYTLTPTATTAPLGGRLFFDMNGSGLADEASFNYDADRLTDERQPLQADLLAAITAYINEHPELQDGDLITLEEPGLSNYTVCAKDICSTTGADGSFVLPGATQNSYLNITDPNAGTPALEMRYINKWNKAVTVPAYEMNGVQVPEQNLNDTEVLPISKTVQVGKKGEIGLMQGFLTLPYSLKDANVYWLTNYVDLDTTLGAVKNYEGNTNQWGNPLLNHNLERITDQHYGLDYDGPENQFVLSSSQGFVFYVGENHNHLQIMHVKSFSTGSGHFNDTLVKLNDAVYRGQIIALNGTYDTSHAHIHIGLYDESKIIEGVPVAVDPYMDLNSSTFTYVKYESMSSVGYKDGQHVSIGSPGFWTVVNLPVFP